MEKLPHIFYWFHVSYPASKAFNGVFDGDGGSATNGANGVVTFTPPAMTVTSLEVNCYSNVTITLPDGTTQSISGSATVNNNRTVDIGSGFSFTGSNSIVFTPPNGVYTYIERIKINGKELVDDDVTVANFPSIASTVRANQTAGFSIATVNSATGSSTASISHGLNTQPHFVIQKSRTNTYGWQVYFKVDGTYKYLSLSSTGLATATTTANMGITPTNLVVGLGSNFSASNDYVYYCFAPVEGYSAFGSYEGNANNEGRYIYTGFRPAFFAHEVEADGTDQWQIHDTTRSPDNVAKEIFGARYG